MEERETTGMGWFIAGLGLGALLGVLFAPKSGRDLRDGLMSGARESKEYVTTRGKQARDQVNSMIDRGRDQFNEYTDKGRDMAERGRERWNSVVDRVSGNQGDEGARASGEPFRGSAAEDRY